MGWDQPCLLLLVPSVLMVQEFGRGGLSSHLFGAVGAQCLGSLEGGRPHTCASKDFRKQHWDPLSLDIVDSIEKGEIQILG